MRDRLIGVLERADLAIASCSGVVGREQLEPLIEVVASVRARLSYPEDVLVVALAGGTGSGKSSLFNAMTGQDFVEVGGRRPTTSAPAAAVPSGIGGVMEGYLDRLGVDERHVYDGPATCLIDLPDTDSVEVEHRHRVDAVLPMVDVVIWVTDPEKYRDSRLHDDYLRPLAGHGPQFLFVLNQTDRVSEEQQAALVADLHGAVEGDGIPRPTVIPVSASPMAGPPIGVDEIADALEVMRNDPATLYRKLLTDLADTARALEAATGGALDFDRRAADTVAEATSLVMAGDVDAGSRHLVDFLDSVAAWLSGDVRERVEKLAAETPVHIRRIATETQPPPEPRRWYERRRPPTQPDPEQISLLINQAIIRPARALLAKRAMAVASITELGLGVESLGSETPR